MSRSQIWKLRGPVPVQYANLFRMETAFLEATIDRSEYLVNLPVTPEFLALAEKIAEHLYFRNNPKSRYQTCYRFGCITVMTNPVFKAPMTKIVINPSNAGFSVRQIFLWIDLIVGRGNLHKTMVKRVEFKIDVPHLDYYMCAKNLWCSAKFLLSSIDRHPHLLHIGGVYSNVRRRVYNKSRHLKEEHGIDIGYELTRLEIIRSYDKPDQVSIIELFRRLPMFNPFEELFMLDGNLSIVYRMIKQPVASYDGLLETLKAVKRQNNRNTIIKHLITKGLLLCFDVAYQQQRDTWLHHSATVYRPTVTRRPNQRYYYRGT